MMDTYAINEDVPISWSIREIIYNFITERMEKTDTHVTFEITDVYVVWFCKTLQNWKALVSTTIPDAMYYEVTCDGDKGVVYVDAYKKWENQAIELVR